MGNKQFLSILGYYNYDETIFDNLVLPEDIDRQLVIDNILLDNSQLSLVYTNFDFMKYAIGSWSKSEYQIWDRLNKAFNEEYNPLWNVDENTTETRHVDEDTSNKSTSAQTSKDVEKITQDETIDENSSSTQSTSTDMTQSTSTDMTQINSIKGFNSDTWAEHDKAVNSGSSANNKVETKGDALKNYETTDSEYNRILDGETNRNLDASMNVTANDEGSRNLIETFKRQRGGNIGVTMSQQLLEAELNVRPKLNIYEYISNSFKKRFCNMIY